jgi:hypothetical protein
MARPSDFDMINKICACFFQVPKIMIVFGQNVVGSEDVIFISPLSESPQEEYAELMFKEMNLLTG